MEGNEPDLVGDSIELVDRVRGVARKAVATISGEEQRTLEDSEVLAKKVIDAVRNNFQAEFVIKIKEGDDVFAAAAADSGDKAFVEVQPTQLQEESFVTKLQNFRESWASADSTMSCACEMRVAVDSADFSKIGIDAKNMLDKHPYLFRHYPKVSVSICIIDGLDEVGKRLFKTCVSKCEQKHYERAKYWEGTLVCTSQGMQVDNPFYNEGAPSLTNTSNNTIIVNISFNPKSIERKCQLD